MTNFEKKTAGSNYFATKSTPVIILGQETKPGLSDR